VTPSHLETPIEQFRWAACACHETFVRDQARSLVGWRAAKRHKLDVIRSREGNRYFSDEAESKEETRARQTKLVAPRLLLEGEATWFATRCDYTRKTLVARKRLFLLLEEEDTRKRNKLPNNTSLVRSRDVPARTGLHQK